LARIILILQCTKTLENLAQRYNNRYVEITSYLTSSKMPFTDKDGHLTKAFQNEKHDIASQLLKEYANRNWSRR